MKTPKIEKNVPIPIGYNHQPYPLADMEIGDSFLITNPSPYIRSNIWAWSRKHARKFTVRKVPGGTRVWRIE